MATYLAATVIIIFLVRILVSFFYKGRGKELGRVENPKWLIYLACFGSGVLFTNFVPHFFHGISGEFFPAPFGKYLGKGFLEYLTNVIWGLVNLYFGYRLFVIGKVLSQNKYSRTLFFAGICVMSIFLCFVFSHFN